MTPHILTNSDEAEQWQRRFEDTDSLHPVFDGDRRNLQLFEPRDVLP